MKKHIYTRIKELESEKKKISEFKRIKDTTYSVLKDEKDRALQLLSEIKNDNLYLYYPFVISIYSLFVSLLVAMKDIVNIKNYIVLLIFIIVTLLIVFTPYFVFVNKCKYDNAIDVIVKDYISNNSDSKFKYNESKQKIKNKAKNKSKNKAKSKI